MQAVSAGNIGNFAFMGLDLTSHGLLNCQELYFPIGILVVR